MAKMEAAYAAARRRAARSERRNTALALSGFAWLCNHAEARAVRGRESEPGAWSVGGRRGVSREGVSGRVSKAAAGKTGDCDVEAAVDAKVTGRVREAATVPAASAWMEERRTTRRGARVV